MTWEAVPAAAVEVAVGGVGGTVAVAGSGAAFCSASSTSTSGTPPAAATCAPSHASHSLETVANCVRHSSPATAAPSSGFSIGASAAAAENTNLWSSS